MTMLAMQEEIGKMSREEKLRAMEWLWTSLAEDEATAEPPAWHAEVLAERRRLAESGEAKFVPWDEARKLLEKEMP